MNKRTREPLFHITKRAALPWWAVWAIRGGALLAALIVCGVITSLVTGENPFQVYAAIYKGSFGTARKLWVLLQNIAMLLCVSLAVTPAFRMRCWNLGGEGQALAGALAAAACMICLRDKLPNGAVILLMIVTSILAGAIWAGIPAFFKARFNTNETLFTLMMNYVAMQLIQVCVSIWAPNGSGVMGHINPDTYKGWLPDVFGQKYLINIVFVTLLTGILFVYLTFSKHGYEISVVGESENTARYIGINVKKVILRTMALSGMICGFAGFLLVAGENHTITKDLAGGMGFTAIMVAWLAKFNPLIMMGVSFLLSFLHLGGVQVAQDCRLNESIPEIITGIILFFIIGCEFFTRYKLNFRSSGKEAAK